MNICDAEKTFILHGVEENFRTDGRECSEYRPMELETGVIQTSFGSARLRLANTDVLASVKIETDTPYTSQPHCGKIEFYVDCSANATPEFEGRGGDSLATQIATCLSAAYKSNNAFDATKLCILKGKKCWKLYVDILILECGGNLYDAVSVAVKAALFDTRLPHVRNVTLDGAKVEVEVADDMAACERLDVRTAPLMVTVRKIGSKCLVDPTDAEERCSLGAVVVACCGDRFSTVLQSCGGSLHPATLLEAMRMGRQVGGRLQTALAAALARVTEVDEPLTFLA